MRVRVEGPDGRDEATGACRTAALAAVAAASVAMAMSCLIGHVTFAALAGTLSFAALSVADLLLGSKGQDMARVHDVRACYATLALAWCAGLSGSDVAAVAGVVALAGAIALCAFEIGDR